MPVAHVGCERVALAEAILADDDADDDVANDDDEDDDDDIHIDDHDEAAMAMATTQKLTNMEMEEEKQ